MDSSIDSFHSALSSDEDSSNSFCSLDDPCLTLDKILSKEFTSLHKNFNICHINAQSLPGHFSEFYNTFNQPNIHAVLISESWLKPSLQSTCFSVPGYVLIRNDRLGRVGGGVAIYLKSHISYKTICHSTSSNDSSSSPDCFEYLFIEINVGVKFALGVVYCPHNKNYFNNLEVVLEDLLANYSHVTIMGDFNTCLLRDDVRARKLNSILMSLNLRMLLLKPTHHTNYADTLLDLIITSNSDLVSKYGQFPASGFSLHDLIFVSLRLKLPKSKPVTLLLRSFQNLNIEKLRSDALSIDWSQVEAIRSIDEKVDWLNSNIIALFDKHAPRQLIKIKNQSSLWFNDDFRKARAKRDKAFSKYKKDRTDLNWSIYKAARNQCNQMCRKLKRQYIFNKIRDSSPEATLKFLKSLGIGKLSTPPINSDLNLNTLNKYFSTFCPLDVSIKTCTLSEIHSLPKLDFPAFTFSSISNNDTKKTILALSTKAVGSDDISRIMITSIVEILVPVITHIVNFSLSSNQFPDVWRKAFILPLPKISNPTLPSHFRPISILPFLSKILESTVYQQISTYFSKCDFLNPLQSGFRTGHSTTTALLRVTEDIRSAMENRHLTVLILIDFSNAFNAVDHELLIALLCNANVSSTALEWFSSYLQGRQQSVRVGQTISDWHDVTAGVPQGGILSPLLFSIFINSITSIITSRYHLYADDLQLYEHSSVENIAGVINSLNANLRQISVWSSKYGVNVNPDKCQAIIVGSSRQLAKVEYDKLPNLTYKGTIINFTKTVKDLGVIIDNKLTWGNYVADISRKIYASLHTMMRLKNFLPVQTKIQLVNTLLLPIIDYGDACCLDMNKDLVNKLERILNTCIRFIYNLRKYDRVSSCRRQLGWLSVADRRKCRVLSLIYSILSDPNFPTYLSSDFSYLSSFHDKSLRSQSNLLLSTPHHTSGYMSDSFAVAGVRLWNELPEPIRRAPSREIFKRRVKESFFINS